MSVRDVGEQGSGKSRPRKANKTTDTEFRAAQQRTQTKQPQPSASSPTHTPQRVNTPPAPPPSAPSGDPVRDFLSRAWDQTVHALDVTAHSIEKLGQPTIDTFKDNNLGAVPHVALNFVTGCVGLTEILDTTVRRSAMIDQALYTNPSHLLEAATQPLPARPIFNEVRERQANAVAQLSPQDAASLRQNAALLRVDAPDLGDVAKGVLLQATSVVIGAAQDTLDQTRQGIPFTPFGFQYNLNKRATTTASGMVFGEPTQNRFREGNWIEGGKYAAMDVLTFAATLGVGAKAAPQIPVMETVKVRVLTPQEAAKLLDTSGSLSTDLILHTPVRVTASSFWKGFWKSAENQVLRVAQAIGDTVVRPGKTLWADVKSITPASLATGLRTSMENTLLKGAQAIGDHVIRPFKTWRAGSATATGALVPVRQASVPPSSPLARITQAATDIVQNPAAALFQAMRDLSHAPGAYGHIAANALNSLLKIPPNWPGPSGLTPVTVGGNTGRVQASAFPPDLVAMMSASGSSGPSITDIAARIFPDLPARISVGQITSKISARGLTIYQILTENRDGTLFFKDLDTKLVRHGFNLLGQNPYISSGSPLRRILQRAGYVGIILSPNESKFLGQNIVFDLTEDGYLLSAQSVELLTKIKKAVLFDKTLGSRIGDFRFLHAPLITLDHSWDAIPFLTHLPRAPSAIFPDGISLKELEQKGFLSSSGIINTKGIRYVYDFLKKNLKENAFSDISTGIALYISSLRRGPLASSHYQKFLSVFKKESWSAWMPPKNLAAFLRDPNPQRMPGPFQLRLENRYGAITEDDLIGKAPAQIKAIMEDAYKFASNMAYLNNAMPFDDFDWQRIAIGNLETGHFHMLSETAGVSHPLYLSEGRPLTYDEFMAHGVDQEGYLNQAGIDMFKEATFVNDFARSLERDLGLHINDDGSSITYRGQPIRNSTGEPLILTDLMNVLWRSPVKKADVKSTVSVIQDYSGNYYSAYDLHQFLFKLTRTGSSLR